MLRGASAIADAWWSIPAVLVAAPTSVNVHGQAGATHRLEALTWGAEDLPAAIGATTSREDGDANAATPRPRGTMAQGRG